MCMSCRVKIGGGGLWGLDPHWKTDNPHCKRQGNKLGGRVLTPLGKLGLIPANAFIMISLVFHYLYCMRDLTATVIIVIHCHLHST